MKDRRASDPQHGKAFLPRIEALRGFAALAVAWGHSTAVLNLAEGAPRGSLAHLVRAFVYESAWAANGRAAVILFFVISGLVLGLMLDAAEHRGAARGYAAFLVRRVFRLCPAHWVALLLFVPLAAFTLFRIPVSDPAFLAAQPPNPRWWFDGTIYGHIHPWLLVRTALLADQFYNSVIWSLRVEMEACLAVPLLVWLTRRRNIALDLLVLATLVAIASLVDTNVRPDAVLLYLPAFYLGAMAGTHGPRVAAALGRHRGATMAALLAAYLVYALPAALTRFSDVRLWLVLDMSAGAFGLVVIVGWATLGRLDSLFLNPLSRWMGRLSYSFYLWHWLVLAAAMRILLILVPGPTLIGRLNNLFFFAVAGTTIPFAFAIAFLSYRWIERPFMTVGRGLAERIGGSAVSANGKLPLAAEAATAP